MEFDIAALDGNSAYKLLIGVIVPRPIAFVTTVDPEGRVNAAPFSFFNMLSFDPPLVALGLGLRAKRGVKDTARNIRSTQAFVVNMVDEALAERMVECSVDFPEEVDELAQVGLTAVPSLAVKPPRIAEAPVSLECRRFTTLEVGRGSNIVLGEILRLHIRDDLVDAQRFRIRQEKLHFVGRLAGSRYCRTNDQFDLPGETYESWQARTGAAKVSGRG